MRFDLHGRLDGATRTPQGGIRATANLTRTGIFLYRTDDGEAFYELRPPDEVFRGDALDSFKGAPLTLGHPAAGVSSQNWRKLAVGHVGDDVRENGRFVTATVYIQDNDVAEKVMNGELAEVSCGYDCDLELTSGEHDEGHFDAIQRNIRGNHVAIGSTNWGRAGTDVRINLDADESPIERARRECHERHADAWKPKKA